MVLSKNDLDALLEKERIEAFEAKQSAQCRAALKPEGAEPNIYFGISLDSGSDCSFSADHSATDGGSDGC